MLNRLWQAVNICSARRAFALVYAGHAHVVSSDEASNFLTHDFESWRDFSVTAPEHEMVTTISWKIRVPRVIVLLFFDRLPKKEVGDASRLTPRSNKRDRQSAASFHAAALKM